MKRTNETKKVAQIDVNPESFLSNFRGSDQEGAFYFELQGDVYPRAFVNQFRMRQVVADVGQIAGDVGYVGCATLGVIAVFCAAYGFIQRLAAETAVYLDGLTEMLSQRFKHFLAKLLEVVYFFRRYAVFYVLLRCRIGAKHLFQSKMFGQLHNRAPL